MTIAPVPIAAFDSAAFAALYAPHATSPDMSDLVQKFGDIHQLVLKALLSIDARTKTLKEFSEPFAGFGIDIAREIPEAREAAIQIAKEDHNLQSMGATSIAKCAGVLDLMMRKNGVDPATCQGVTHQAFEMCAASLPERARAPWRDYFETIGLALATVGPDGSLPARAGTPRI